MTSSVSTTYTSDQIAQLEQLRQEIEAYCEANGIDPNIYLSALDGGTIDEDLKNDPVFQAYWELAYRQLVEIIAPTEIYSEYGSIDEIDFDTLYELTESYDPSINSFIETLLADDPELMAYYQALETGDVDAGTAVLMEINQLYVEEAAEAAEDAEEYLYTQEDRDYAEEHDLTEEFTSLLDTIEATRAAETSIMTQLAEMDQTLAELAEAMNSGEISTEEYSAEVESLSASREMLMTMLQALESSLSTILEMYSKLLEQMRDMESSIASNTRAYS